MLFNSYIFLFTFLPASLLAYFLAGRIDRRAAGLSLVISSLIFYTWWNPPFVLVLLGSILFNYAISRWIAHREGHERAQTAILALGIGVDLAVLVYYKYLFVLAGFLTGLGLGHLELAPIILPLGLSFYTFTQIGYLVDCRQNMAKERSIFEYFLFVTFFPHLIAGPIIHHREIMPQFAKPETYRLDAGNVAVGLTFFLIGLAKKVLLADSMIQLANAGFAAPGTLGLFTAWLTALSYSMQIYFDFSGYSDMAIGLAYMFNIRFPLNFNSPYKARSVIDFWQRWHMTLTRYLTLYLYNPMAIAITRRRAAKGLPISSKGAGTVAGFLNMIALPIFFTMTLAGIWHGAGFQFLVFGLLHGAYLTVNHAWRIFKPTRLSRAAASPLLRPVTAIAQVLLTYIAVMVAQIFFRAASSGDAVAMLAGMIGRHGGGFGGWENNFGSTSQSAAMLLVYFIIVWAMPNSQEIMAKFPAALGQIKAAPYGLLQWNPGLRWALLIGGAAGMAVANLSRHTEFLYFQF
ncbi:MAG: MBOAT family protein [Alphaproteobacteria bacterium]|nr:MBOAT family protein [Alphaproteobacteria bacterium]